MNKKLIVISIILLILNIFLSGCTEDINQIIDDIISKNSRPVGIITAPENAYFEETIVFDASNSYDLDGNIVQFAWDFGDGETAEGKIIEHTYKFDKDFDIVYPLIFQVSLVVKDNNDSITGTNHLIKISPKEYKFYLCPRKIILDVTSENHEKIKATFSSFRIGNELIFNLDNFVNISSCKWNLNLHIKKPLFAHLKKVTITLFDSNNKEISKAELNFEIFEFWRDKVITIEDFIEKLVEFKSIKVTFIGFTLFKRINIIYGGQEPSNIYFDFTT